MPEGLRFHSYRQWAEEIEQRLQAALAGEYEVPPQQPFAEAWMAYALSLGARFRGEAPLPLKDMIESADFIAHGIPSLDEVAWAFLRLEKRGWLAEQGNLYGLTAEGRRVIEGIVGEGSVLDRVERLKKWISIHPPPDGE